MMAIAHHQLNGSGDTKNVYHVIDMSVVLILIVVPIFPV